MDEDNNQSIDDALEQDRTEDTVQDGTAQAPLPEDNDSPAAPADDSQGTLPVDHPTTDTETDAHELYDEGAASATDTDAQTEAPADDSNALHE